MSFKAIRQNKIVAKISGFTVSVREQWNRAFFVSPFALIKA